MHSCAHYIGDKKLYVKCQVRDRKRRGGSPLLTAVLVECRRINGRPRQSTVGYLGSIRERHVGKTAREHFRFWACVDDRLDELWLDTVTRLSIEASVAARVPRITAENEAVFNAETERVCREIAADLASIGIKA